MLHQHHPRLAIARARGVPLNNLRKVRAVAALTQLRTHVFRGEALGEEKKAGAELRLHGKPLNFQYEDDQHEKLSTGFKLVA